jgi:hypothetical protein
LLSSEEVKPLLTKDRINVWSYWGFPAATYGLFHYTGLLNRFVEYKYTPSSDF